jgi:hypothetical protein
MMIVGTYLDDLRVDFIVMSGEKDLLKQASTRILSLEESLTEAEAKIST